MKAKQNIALTVSYIFLGIIAIVTLIPFLYTIMSSFKTNSEILVNMKSFFPETYTFDNYKQAWSSPDFNISVLLKNSMIYTVFQTVTQVLIAAMAGYAFEKGRFPCKNLIFACFTALMFIKLGGISIYATFDVLNLLHLPRNLYSLMFVNLFGINIVNIYLVRSYVASISGSIIEAAKIDGCDFFRTFWQIVFPLLKPILTTIALLTVKSSWNDYIMPTIFTMTKPEQRTLIVGLMSLKNSSGAASQWNLMLAGSVVTIIPIFVLYVFLNKYFVEGLSAGAVKE